jgi:ubiquitin-conjugating enzyme E2 D/E
MDGIDDPDTLEEIKAAASDAESVVPTAATARYQALKGEKGKTSANKAPVQVQDHASSSSQARGPLKMNVSFLDSALESEQPPKTASDDQEEMEGFNNSGYDVRYSGEIVGDFAYPVVDTRPFKVFKGGKDGQPRCPLLLAPGTKVTGLTFPPESGRKGAFMDLDGQTYEIPLTRVILDIPDTDDIITTWKGNWEGQAKWDFKYGHRSGATAYLEFRRGEIIRHIAFKSRDQPIWSGYNPRGQWGYFPRVFIEVPRKCKASHFFENIPGPLWAMEFPAQLAELRRFQLHFLQEMGQPFGLPEITTRTATPSDPSSMNQNTLSKMEQFVSANHVTIRRTIEGLRSESQDTYKHKQPNLESALALPFLKYGRVSTTHVPSKRIWHELCNELESEGEDKLVTFAPLGLGNVLELLGTICGPGESPYADGIFHVRISVSVEYPFMRPRFWFLTKVYHPNIDDKGAICFGWPRVNWIPSISLKIALILICSMLSEPSMFENPEDISPPLVPEIAHQWKVDRATFERTAREWTKRYATGEIIWRGMRLDGFSNTTGCFAIRKQIVDGAAKSP